MIHPLDRFFRKKLEQSPHEMEEAHWLQALELLEAQDDRRRRKGIPFWLWIALPLVIGAVWWSLRSVPGSKNVPVAGLETISDKVVTQSSAPPPIGATEKILSHSEQKAALPDAEEFKRRDKNVIARQISKGGGGAMIVAPVAGKSYLENQVLPAKISGENKEVITSEAIVTVIEANSIKSLQENPAAAQPNDYDSKDYFTKLLPLPEIKPLIHDKYADPAFKPGEITSCEQEVTQGYSIVMGIGAGTRLLPVRPTGYSPLPGFEGGLFFTGHIRDNWSWYLDVQYALLKGDLPFTKENQVTQYSFGRQIFDQRLQPLSLHYAAASLSVNRTFGRHSIGLSTGFDRLAGVRGMITVSGAYPPETDTLSYNVPMWIKKDGFNRWNIPVRLNWTYQLNHRLAARLGIGYYFRNIFDDQHLYPVPVTSSSLQQFHLETGIRYALFELKSVGK